MNTLTLYNTTFPSRLLLGTAAYPSLFSLKQSWEAAQPAMLTVSLRRQGAISHEHGEGLWQELRQSGVAILPNTAGCLSAQEAITTAHMAREVFETPWIKLEIIADDSTLQPDVFQLVEAAKVLIYEGFYVLPYCTEDLVVARALLDVGCQALMPWAAPIGTGMGPVNAYGLQLLREHLSHVPLIVDAGIGLPSHAATVMEWGFDGVLLNTAVSQSGEPPLMARAFKQAIEAGRAAYLATPISAQKAAKASTPTVGMPFWHQESGE